MLNVEFELSTFFDRRIKKREITCLFGYVVLSKTARWCKKKCRCTSARVSVCEVYRHSNHHH